jgi:hypothetical protein
MGDGTMYEFNGRVEGTIEASYQHPRLGRIDAVTANGPGQVDWRAVCNGRTIGYITDERDGPNWPDPEPPEDEDSRPYAVADSRSRYIAETHSLPGALLIIGNHVPRP